MGLCEAKNEGEQNSTPISLSINSLNIIKEIIRKSICKIKLKNEEFETGFFCKIPYPDKNNFLPTLIINNHILEKKQIFEDQKLILLLYDEKQLFKIKLNDERKIYKSNKYDIAIIEIITYNKDLTSFLEIDEELFKDNKKDIYNEQFINLIYYSQKNNIECSHGIIKNIYENNYTISYLCENQVGIKSGLILNSTNNKVIGIHRESKMIENQNFGTLIIEPINDFNNKFKSNEVKSINSISINNINNNLIINNITPLQNIKDKEIIVDNNIQSNSLNKNLNNNINNNPNHNNNLLKALLLALTHIEKLKAYFNEDLDLKKGILIDIIKKYMKYKVNGSYKLDDAVYEIKQKINKINELNKTILGNSNFEELINFILNKFHEELNNKIIFNKQLPKGDSDEKIAFNNFKKYYFEQNDSIIQKLFFNVIENIEVYKCCKLKQYNFNICKYIFENLTKSINLQNLISEWENRPIKSKKLCPKCKVSANISYTKNLYINSEILIIIINNNKNIIEINFDKILKTKNFEYKLICCISENKFDDNFNITYNSQDFWYKMKTNDNHRAQIGNTLGNLILYPLVFFYERGKKINNDYKSDIFFSENENIINNNKNDVSNFTFAKKNPKFNIISNESKISNKSFKTNKKSDYSSSSKNINKNLVSKEKNNITNITNESHVKPNNFDNSKEKNQTLLEVPSNISYIKKIEDLYQIESTQNDYFINKIEKRFSSNNNNTNVNINSKTNVNTNKQNLKLINNNTLDNSRIYPSTMDKSHKHRTFIKKTGVNNEIKSKNDIYFNKYVNENKSTNNNIKKQNVEVNNINDNQMENKNNQMNNNNLLSNKACNVLDTKITLKFYFEDGKKIEIKVKESITFQDTLNELYNRYLWLKNKAIIDFHLNGNHISKRKTLKDNGLKDNSKIMIIENKKVLKE